MGDHIRRSRLIFEITQKEAALRLGVDAWTVHNWETGERRPEIRFIPAFVGFLGYDLEPVHSETFADRLVSKGRELGLSQQEIAR